MPDDSINLKSEYLGDGVYASHDGYQIILTTETETYGQSVIFLEPMVFYELVAYQMRLRENVNDKHVTDDF